MYDRLNYAGWNAVGIGHVSPSAPCAYHTGRTICRLFFGLVVGLQPLISQAQTPEWKAPPEKLVDLEEVVIRVNADSDREQTTHVIEIEPEEVIEDFFDKSRGNQIDWNPRENLESTFIKSILTQDILEIGDLTDNTKAVFIKYSTEPLLKGKKGTLSIGLNAPQSLSPGIYKGELLIPFKPVPANRVSAAIVGRVLITIAVEGRVLQSVNCVEADEQSLRVGQTSTVTAVLDTIGCDPGEGELNLQLKPLAGDKISLAVLPLPFVDGDTTQEPGRSVDPFTGLSREKGQVVCQAWRDAPVQATMVDISDAPETPQNIVPDASYHRYLITFEAGDYYEPGEILVSVTWSQSKNAPAKATNLSQERRASIESGLLVDPPLAFDTEVVSLWVKLKQAPGDNDEKVLHVADPAGVTHELQLLDTTSEATGYYRYEAALIPSELSESPIGRWIVKGAGSSVEFQVSGQLQTYRLARPIQVFVGLPPFWWEFDFLIDEFDGSGKWEHRRDAFSIGVDRNWLSNAKIRPLGIYSGGVKDPDIEGWNPESQPLLFIQPGTNTAAGIGSLLAVHPDKRPTFNEVDQESNPLALVSATEAAAIPEQGLLDFQIHTSVEPNETGDHPRQQLKRHYYVLRAELTGQNQQSQAVSRIIEIPFQIEVTDSGQYYKEFGLAVLLVIALFGLMYFLKNRIASPTSSPVRKGDAAVPSVPQDSFGRPVVDNASPQTTPTPNAPPSPPESHSPPPPQSSNDLDDFRNA